MEISEEFKCKMIEYLELPRTIEVLTRSGINPANIDGISKYLDTYPVPRYAEQKFLKSLESYIKNLCLPRDPDGFVNSRDMLEISRQGNLAGMRGATKCLGHDGEIYIKKQAEGVKGQFASSEGKYNPTMAKAVFEFLGEKSAEYIPAIEGIPYYYIISRDFLKENQKLIQLDNDEMTDLLENDKSLGEKNIAHSRILLAIEKFIKKRLQGKTEERRNRSTSIKYKIRLRNSRNNKRFNLFSRSKFREYSFNNNKSG